MKSKLEYAVKAIIMNKEGKMLVLKQEVEERTFYTLPGGRIENNLDEKEELKREILEETGLKVEVGECVGEWMFERKDGTKTICKTYLIKSWRGEIDSAKKMDYEKISPIWLYLDDFAEKYTENESLKALIRGLRKNNKI